MEGARERASPMTEHLHNLFLISGTLFFFVGAIVLSLIGRILYGLLTGKLRWGTRYL